MADNSSKYVDLWFGTVDALYLVLTNQLMESDMRYVTKGGSIVIFHKYPDAPGYWMDGIYPWPKNPFAGYSYKNIVHCKNYAEAEPAPCDR